MDLAVDGASKKDATEPCSFPSIASIKGSAVSLSPVSNNFTNMLDEEQLRSLCDLVLVVEEEECHAHRAVLASASPVFATMFTNGMKESNPSGYPQRITLPEVSYRCCKLLLRFLYSGTTELDNGNEVYQLLACAHKYQFEDLTTAISKLLERHVTDVTAIDLWKCSERYVLQTLRDACYSHLENQFEEMSARLDYSLCAKELMYQLIRSDDVKLTSEVTIVSSVLRWVAANGAEGQKEKEAMLSCVRVDRMTSPELIEAGLEVAKSGGSVSFSVNIMQALSDMRFSDSVWHVSLDDRSYLVKCKRSVSPFSFISPISGLQRASDAFILTGGKTKILESMWVGDPRQPFSAQILLAVCASAGSSSECEMHLYLRLRPRDPSKWLNYPYSVPPISCRIYIVDFTGKVRWVSDMKSAQTQRDLGASALIYKTSVLAGVKNMHKLAASESDVVLVGGNVIFPDSALWLPLYQ
eukprot:Plantae.Rhodophyta-Hildenbrandia_rubra.ctg18507.p1 GENE.Plantae.Rhodophyta-Hildenbrandia_rubra.ctg18507~~Plantae.Rhodophyta-Hildenbrandia_rubra.ctg18507.p1  ORF type:complete len:469 (+),score=39.99 Plantae.Rhodophyta-Hildenbrandia_rubra.ctg18507:82-1488(+)